jgi:phosphoribosylamine--glycine ligase
MNLLVISTEGTAGLDFCIRARSFGHVVRLFIRNNKDGSRSDTGVGLIERVPHWEPHMGWADLIFCTDNNFYSSMLDNYIVKGYPVFGCSSAASLWEQDREIGAEVFKRAGIKTIPSKTFTKYDEAIAYVNETNKRFVCKPIGDGDKALSYVAKSPKDMIFMLGRWKKEKAHKGAFVLQEFRGGIEMAVGGWFGQNGFSKYKCENWEFKKQYNDDLGVATGEQGTVLRYTEGSKLAGCVLDPLEDLLHGLGYFGYIDVNCIIDKEGTPWPLEFTMRPGWPLFQIQQRLHKGDPCEWMIDSLDGIDSLKVSKDIAIGVVISMPPYPVPYLTKKECSGYPLFGLEMDDALDCVHLSEVQKGVEEEFDTAGDYVCTVSGLGKTVSDAKCEAYKNIKSKIEIPNSIGYRTDISDRLKEQIPVLHSLGYCKDLIYG